MKKLISPDNDDLISIKKEKDCNFTEPQCFSNYSVIFIPKGKGHYHADFGVFEFEGPTILFSTPLQHIYLVSDDHIPFVMLQFHGDFYCIEYHKEQVSCNGLLFNNIYIEPSIVLNESEAKMFLLLLDDMENELMKDNPDDVVLISYLQLFLAKSSGIKNKSIENDKRLNKRDEQMETFMRLLDENYLKLHKPNDYAGLLAMTPNNFSKRCIRYFKKSPSALIQERIILEAKKKLHLTRMSIKEIAYSLNFEDEYYFSRFFKKVTTISPQFYRERTGISIVADLSN
ncbi:helix-turn-helix domain-containing protein [Flavobacterium artemisiae]|uniref:Helix-turn-helix domain-containing protein n=1 Tax=Flavobacterium artemisiae TaxID=2126556 RepID=A0ABW4HJ24_9FLAO